MKKIIFPEIYKNENSNSLVAVLGKFETMHIGHLKIIEEARTLANNTNSELLLMMFSERDKDNFYSFEERVMFANKYSPEYILEFEPTKENFSFTWKEFNKYLLDMGVNKIVCGHDFQYGNNRQGNIETLREDFEVKVIDEVENETESIRTTIIYDAIKNDDYERFKNLMGHYFFYKGKVVRGLGNGRKFNMPTANVEYPKYKLDVNYGIYYSYVIYDGKRMPSLTSISDNPTLDADKTTYETYIYNFDKDIYDEEIYVELIEKFRDPIKFNSLDELVEALEKDKILGKKFFNI